MLLLRRGELRRPMLCVMTKLGPSDSESEVATEDIMEKEVANNFFGMLIQCHTESKSSFAQLVSKITEEF